MPYNKKDDRKHEGKRYGKAGRPEDKRDRSVNDRKGIDAKRRTNLPLDKDELAPPRFLPDRYKRTTGPKKNDRLFDRKREDRFGGDKRNEKDQWTDRKKNAPGKPVKWDKNDLANSRFFDRKKDRGGPGSESVKKGTERPAGEYKGKNFGQDAGKSFRDSGSKPFREDREKNFRNEKAGKKDFNSLSGNNTETEKKPFRPKYDPEIKPVKNHRERTAKTPRERKKELGVTDDPSDIRLNKYIANSGICSRREADELIRQGLVTVNGNVVTEMGHKVKKEDVVRYEGRKILPEPFVYILMNKPKDFITTTDDEKGRKTVLDLLADKIPQRVYPVGRLDRNTTGVLLLTNDGEVAQALTHPAFEIKKVYHVVLDKKVSSADLDKLVAGITLEDGEVFADAVTYVDNEDKSHVGVEIHSGRNRVVRRMFEHLGYEVEKLDRVSMGVFTKKDLPRGKWRHLSQAEVGFLMKLKNRLNS